MVDASRYNLKAKGQNIAAMTFTTLKPAKFTWPKKDAKGMDDFGDDDMDMDMDLDGCDGGDGFDELLEQFII